MARNGRRNKSRKHDRKDKKQVALPSKFKKHKVIPDPKYASALLGKFINKIMYDGKKTVAQKLIYDAFAIIHEKTGEDPRAFFEKALDNLKPDLEVKSRRVGGATYQVPTEVRADRRIALAMRWLINESRSRNEKSMEEKLAAELMDAHKRLGKAFKKKEDAHKMAEANRAFSSFRW